MIIIKKEFNSFHSSFIPTKCNRGQQERHRNVCVYIVSNYLLYNYDNYLQRTKLYPCEICREHFKNMIEKYPIKHANRNDLVYYFCMLHNEVNERLNKPYFDCKKAFDFWGGNCNCGLDQQHGNVNKWLS